MIARHALNIFFASRPKRDTRDYADEHVSGTTCHRGNGAETTVTRDMNEESKKKGGVKDEGDLQSI